MFSSNQLKIIFLAAFFGASACSLWRGNSDANTAPAPFVAEELKSQIPFSTKEPDAYQTEIVVTANGAADRFFAARDKENRITIFNYQTDAEISDLQIGSNQDLTIAAKRKIYVEAETSAKSDAATDFFTAEWLNQKTDAKFEKIEPENNLARYRVNLENTRNSEIIVYVDETINLPVKQEFYMTKDGQRTLTLTVELRNFNSAADANLFVVPKDFKKVSSKEFYEPARTSETKK